jgi:ATP-dependent Clp protease adapter protein ClpS
MRCGGEFDLEHRGENGGFSGMGRLMAAPSIIEKPQIDDGSGSETGDLWVETVFNNDYNTWDEVVNILIKATGCSLNEAEMETWEIDNLGKSVVHHGEKDECHSAAEVIRQIGIRVEVSTE